MENENVLLPALKPMDWPGREVAVCRPLIPDVKQSGIPWVGFGYDHPHTFEFVTQATFPAKISTDQIRMLEQAALRNLRKRPAAWRVESVRLGMLKYLRVLINSDDYLAAERILDLDFMQQAHQKLRTRLLAVGIPCRGMILAINASQPQELIGRFCAMVSAHYHRSPSAPISPQVFTVADGVVIGMITGLEDAGKRLANLEEDQHPVTINAQIGVDHETGAESLYLMVGCQDLEQVNIQVVSAFVQALEEVSHRPAFNGQVQVIFLPEQTPFSPELQDLMAKLQEHLNGLAKEIKFAAQDNRPVQVVVQYGQQK